MTHQEAKYIVEKFENYAMGRILKGDVTGIYYETERIIKGKDKIQKRGCTCEYKNMARIVTSLFEQHKAEIHRLYEEAISLGSGSGTSSTDDLSGSTE